MIPADKVKILFLISLAEVGVRDERSRELPAVSSSAAFTESGGKPSTSSRAGL